MIPIIRTYPDGRRVAQGIARGEDVELLAARFIKLGGRYQAAVLADGRVRLAATIPQKGEEIAIEGFDAANDATLPAAIDRLVTLSDMHVSEMWLGEESDLPRA